MRSYKIYLYRHGITDGNLEGKYIGITDVDLCQQGIDQLHQLAQQYEYPNVGKVYSSPLKRCTQTAQILYPEMSIQTVSKLQEYNFGIYENKTIDQLKQTPGFAQWLSHQMTIAPEGGENMQSFQQRIREGFDWVVKDMMKQKISSAAVFTHGGVIMSLLGMCGLPKANPTHWMVKNGHGYSILVNASLWGNTMSFEICDKLPYGEQDIFDKKTFELLDVEELKRNYQNEQS